MITLYNTSMYYMLVYTLITLYTVSKVAQGDMRKAIALLQSIHDASSASLHIEDLVYMTGMLPERELHDLVPKQDLQARLYSSN